MIIDGSSFRFNGGSNPALLNFLNTTSIAHEPVRLSYTLALIFSTTSSGSTSASDANGSPGIIFIIKNVNYAMTQMVRSIVINLFTIYILIYTSIIIALRHYVLTLPKTPFVAAIAIMTHPQMCL